MNQPQPTFIEIPVNDLRYRQVLTAAMKHRDKEALSALKGNTHKPIFYVKNWFSWGLMTLDHEQSHRVVIYSPQTRQDFALSKTRRSEPDTLPNDPTIPPIDCYHFLD